VEKAPPAAEEAKPAFTRPSFKWALLHNWMYFLALGLAIPVLPRVISAIVNADGSSDVSPASSIVSGDVEALDKLLTFLFVGFLGSLSDVYGRKPLMAYSALGFAITCWLQGCASRRLSLLYVADLVDGMSSCMNNVCQAYVTDASPPDRRAANLGIFQGLSVAGAFILGFPLSAVIQQKYGYSAPLKAAALVGVLNFLIVVFFTPESLPAAHRVASKVDLATANPLGTLSLLFRRTPLLRAATTAFFLIWFGNACINSIFGNYVNHLFKWGPAESAPLLVLVGLMIAIAPPLLGPRLGLKLSIQVGAVVYGLGLLATAFASSPPSLVYSVLFTSVGCICIPALVAFIANQAQPNERGALLGGLETLQELCLALAHSTYGRVFGYFISDKAPIRLPGAPFILAAVALFAGFGTMTATFSSLPDQASKFL